MDFQASIMNAGIGGSGMGGMGMGASKSKLVHRMLRFKCPKCNAHFWHRKMDELRCPMCQFKALVPRFKYMGAWDQARPSELVKSGQDGQKTGTGK